MRNVCDRCDAPLIEIDHYGDRLKGCIECNIWRGGKNAFVVELSVEDIEALRVVRQARQGELQLQSTLTCPHCGHQTIETMPTDACVAIYDCKGCGATLRPLPGSCCVFCSYGSVPCPPIQEGVEACR